MATIKAPWGGMRGSIGNLVFRQRDKKTIISSVPQSFRTPTDAAAVSRRTKFKFVLKLSSAICRLLSLKLLWTRCVPVGNNCLIKVFKSNYPGVSNILEPTAIQLIENPTIDIANVEINLQSTNVQVTIPAIGPDHGIDLTDEKTICAEGVLFLSAPLDEAAPPFAFVPFVSPDVTLVLNDSLTFNAPLNDANKLQYIRYATKKAALVLITKDTKKVPVHYSNTLTQ